MASPEVVVRVVVNGEQRECRASAVHLPAVGGEVHLWDHVSRSTVRKLYHRLTDDGKGGRLRGNDTVLELVVELEDVTIADGSTPPAESPNSGPTTGDPDDPSRPGWVPPDTFS